MIAKSFEIQKLDINKYNFMLFHGDNEGAKNDIISRILFNNKDKKKLNYEEKQLLENPEEFFNEILTESLFDEEKILIIKRATNKIFNIISEIYEKNPKKNFIIINSIALEKKSKLRNLFEKKKNLLSVAFYPDTDQTLVKLAINFFKNFKISISQSNINLIVSKCNGDRESLYNELKKIQFFAIKNPSISTSDIIKLTNLTENHNVSKLVNYCLAQDIKKTVKILNENNFSNEDCILITRTFLNKTKKVLALSIEFEKNKNIDQTINSAKPPIFWKDKEIIKEQIYKWKPNNLRSLIYKINEIELLIKKNVSNSINMITDFVINQTSSKINN